MTSLLQLLKFAAEKGASDVHVSARSSPGIRLNGKIVKIKMPAISSEDSRVMCYSVLSDEQKHQFEEKKELDFSFELKGVARFRANYYFHKGSVAGVFRKVPVDIPDFDTLGLPAILKEFAEMPNGLVLVTGPTGSGKTTTIASLLDIINKKRYGHIMTLEDPIEYMHSHGRCMVSQREIGLGFSLLHQCSSVCGSTRSRLLSYR